MAKYRQDNAASVQGLVMRVTRLDAEGFPAEGGVGECDTYITSGFVRVSFTPSYKESDEISITNAAGDECVYYKAPDTLQYVDFSLEVCDPDPVLTEMLAGGQLLLGDEDSPGAPPNMATGDLAALGYASPLTGVRQSENGVGVEVWAQAIIGGKAAASAPYWQYVFPYANYKLDGERVLENGNVATVFAGRGLGNVNFGSGPYMDTTGITPAITGGRFDWLFPSVTDRPFAYARTAYAPVGLQGCFKTIESGGGG